MADIPPFGVPLSRGDTLVDQVTRALRSSVTDSTWPVGAAVPSEARLATNMQVSLKETITAGRHQAVKRGGAGRGAAAEHDGVLHAIAERDAPAAREQMRCHLAQASKRLLGQLRARPGDTA